MRTVNNPVPGGNIFTIILLIVKSLLLLAALTFALVSLGVFADKNNDIKKITENSPFSDHYCILFIDDDQGFSSNSICQFVIGGQATVSFLILAALVTIVLAVIIKRSATVFNILVIFVIILAVLMSLVVAIVISSGLSKTCKTLIETGLFKKCSDIDNVPRGVHFFHTIQSSMACTWVECLLLIGFIGFSAVLLVLSHKKNSEYGELK